MHLLPVNGLSLENPNWEMDVPRRKPIPTDPQGEYCLHVEIGQISKTETQAKIP